MFFSPIFFAVKILLAAFLVIPLFLSKNSPISRDRIGIFSIVSIVSATLTAISLELDTALLAASLFVAIGIVSLTQFQKEDKWIEALMSVAPFWLVAVIGMCVGAGMLLQAIILTAVSYYILDYLPMLVKSDKGQSGS